MIKRARVTLNIFALLFCFSTVYSQQAFKDSTETYNYWAERGVIEMTYAYMHDYIASIDTLKNSKENKGYKDFYLNYIKDIDKKDVVNINSDFLSFNDFLIQNDWAVTSKKISEPLIEARNQSKTLNDAFFGKINNNNNSKFWDSKKKEVIENYNKELKSLSVKPEIDQVNPVSNPPVETITSKYYKRDPFIYRFIFLLVGFISGGLLIYFYTKFKIYSILFAEKEEYIKRIRVSEDYYLFRFISMVKVLKVSKDDKQIEIDSLKEKIKNSIKQNNDNLTANKDNFEEKSTIVDKIEQKSKDNLPVNAEWQGADVTLSKKVFYFSIPFDKGYFLDEFKTLNKEHNSFYKVEIIKENTGKLYFITGEFDKTALNDINGYLTPVCTILNIEDRLNANKIEFISPGIVTLFGDQWTIDKNNKVKIKLI